MFEEYSSTSNPLDLVNAIVVDDSGIEIDPDSITFIGVDGQTSFYDGSIPELGIGEGILLTSGDGNPPTSNTTVDFSLEQEGIAPDPQLQAVADSAFEESGEVQDINSLEFSFNVSDPNVESVSFNLVFGSDEFPEFSDSFFVDVGAVFLNGQNVGLFNNEPNQPLSIISENLNVGNFQDNADNSIPIEYDGVSSVLSVVAPVEQGENTIRFAIADTGDQIFDSGLFISNLTTSGVATGDDGSGVVLNAPGTEEADEIIGDPTDQFIEGLAGDDTINPGNGNDIVDAGAGDDLIFGGIGSSNSIDGGDGNDTVIYSGNQNELTTETDGNSITVSGNNDGGEFTDTLTNIETIQYGNESISTDTIQPTVRDSEEIELVTNSTEGYYNSSIGDLYPGDPSDPLASFFPGPNVSTGVPTADFSTEPDISTISELGDWLDNPESAIQNGFWSDLQSIPQSWDVNTETAIIYEVDGGENGIQNVTADFVIDNSILVWVNGEYRFGVGNPTNFTVNDASLGDLNPGKNYIQIVRADYGVVADYQVQITGNQIQENEDITGVPVYRFFRTDTQTQFYTTTELERDVVLDTLPQYELEGISFFGVTPPEAETDPLTGTLPVYRFFNRSTGIHLYTSDENERNFVEDNLDNYVFEGTPYYGYETQEEGTVPLYRFYNPSLDAHFYTPSVEERDFFLESPDYEPEGGGDGIAFYVDPVPEL